MVVQTSIHGGGSVFRKGVNIPWMEIEPGPRIYNQEIGRGSKYNG
jgi:hypothetical protein